MSNKVIFPIILVGVKNNLEIITNSKQLTSVTSLSLKDRTLIDGIIFDNNGASYKINGIVKLRNLNPWWKFEFFNPMIKIELDIENYAATLSESKNIIIKAIKYYPDFWNTYDLEEITTTILRSNAISEIIRYLMSIRGIL